MSLRNAGAPESRARRPPDGGRLRVRLHRAPGRRLRRLALLRVVLRLALRRRAHPAARPAPATRTRTSSRSAASSAPSGSPRSTASTRPGLPPGALGRRRACRVRRASCSSSATTASSTTSSTSWASRPSSCSSCPRSRGSAARSTARRSGSTSGRSSSSPASSPRSCSSSSSPATCGTTARCSRTASAGGRLPSPKHLGPLLLIWGGAMLVLFQTRDLGGALLYFAIFLVMLYTATARWSFVAAGIGLFLAGAVRPLPGDPARPDRVQGWLDPWGDPQGDSRTSSSSRSTRSRAAGVFGSGLGDGVLAHARGQALHPVPGDRLHLLGDRPGARAGRRGGASSSSTSSSPSAASASRCSPTTGSPSCSPPA